MIHNLKALCMAVLAMFAISAMVAGAAQAEPQFTAAKYPATFKATTEQKIGAESEYAEATKRKIECEVSHIHGQASGSSSSLTVTVDYTDSSQGGNCKASGLLNVLVTENGCEKQFFGLTKMGADYTTHTKIVCPAGKVMETHIGTSCTITIAPQTVTGTLTITNALIQPYLKYSGSYSYAQTVHSSSTLLCGVEAGTSKEEVANYVINKEVGFIGENGGSSIAISVSGE